MNFIKRVKKARWTYRQSLTKKPKEINSKISDLFVWRSSQDWKTFFELTDISALFMQEKQDIHYADIVLFNSLGGKILTKKVKLSQNERMVINLSEILLQADNSGEFGTFAVFHSYIPEVVSNLNSFIAERGYLSYTYKDSPLKSYVHGNFDAISNHNENFSMLGGSSLLNREYRLQYELNSNSNYEVGVVNASGSVKKISCEIVDENNKIIKKESISIRPRGVGLFIAGFDSQCHNTARIIIKSKLVMARPLIFRINKDYFDVFHG
jgi:hypothetical protein